MYLFFILYILLTEVKSCPLTDDYLSRCHCEILINGESYIKCDEKSLNQIPIFKRSFPYDELILSNNNIETLPRSSFDNIKTIRRINLENNSLSFIDYDILRLLGNYLEELTLTGNTHLNSLEFLTRYPLKKLRILKLNQFNLSQINLEKLFLNMTKLEIISLRSCQLKSIPNLPNIKILDLQNNQISNSISLSSSYQYLNLAQNFISSIILQTNLQLLDLNLSKNNLNKFFLFSLKNSNLQDLNLSENQLTSFDFSNLNLQNINLNYNRLLSIDLSKISKNLLSLSLKNNLIKQIKFANRNSSLSSLDLSSNQLKFIEKNSLFEKLNYLNLAENPLECNCHLEWLRKLILYQNKINASTWTCTSTKFLSADFQCSSMTVPRIVIFNISYVKISSENGLFIQWTISDDYNTLDYIQISISEPFYLSPKFPANQTQIFLSNYIQLNKQYHICLILVHKYAREKYCREFLTDKLLLPMSNEIRIEKNAMQGDQVYMMLVGSCIGGLLTFILIFTCCYLCFQIYKFNSRKKNQKNISDYSRKPNLQYPIYHSHSTTCPYHHENLSNSTNSSQIDASLSPANLKHIYQTIDSQDYASLKQNTPLFHLWNESLKHKR